MPYDRGDVVRTTATFTNTAGTAADPTAVVARVRTPNSPPTTFTTYTYGVGADIVKTATGVYYLDVTCSLGGTYYVRWEGTGAVVQAEEDTWDVDQGAFVAP
jgi:hypothetical protein